ncbi:lysine--tRNA ligase [Candidatus Saccharibacteria bacterium]|jgi:lysyl-tRNA synthetase class 2|nr:lysine--tRNA ligase [Candidatus Saccharibacteria bacterium]
MATLQEYRNERLEKLAKIRELGYEPYPAKSHRDTEIKSFVEDFEGNEGKQVIIAGRIMAMRGHGKLKFFDLMDGGASTQLLIRSDALKGDVEAGKFAFEHLDLLGRGDFIEASGRVGKTKTGQVSVEVDSVRILTKAIRTIPDNWTGLADKETRLRRRYLDTVTNADVKNRFIRRANFWKATRDFLNNEGFIEINTPILEHTTGGADAKPFETHMDALDEHFYLRISHELPLKRLIGGGYDKVFDIGPRFRNENYSDEHLPEHVAMESYAAYDNYQDGIKLYERMMKEVALATWGRLQFENVNGFEVNLDQDWPQIEYADIMKDRFNVDVFNPDLEQLKEILKTNEVKIEGDITATRALDNVWKIIRRESAGPFWLVHEPVEISPLAKQDPEDARVTQRFHPVIAGTEMGNGYSELNDPVDQLNRFKQQQDMREDGDDEAQMLDIDFVEMLEYGMPPACGWGHSERFFWMFEGVSAREGVPFPQLRRETSETTKAIYPEIDFTPKKNNQQVHKTVDKLPDDSDYQFVVVVNESIEIPKLMNAIAHATNGLVGAKMHDNILKKADYVAYEDSDKQLDTVISHYATIIFRASNSKDLLKLHNKFKQNGFVVNTFTQAMTVGTSKEQIEQTASQPLEDQEIFCIVTSGRSAELKKVTKHLQLLN